MKSDIALHGIERLQDYPQVSPWERPSDWLTMPNLVDGDQRFVGLFAVYDTDAEYLSMLVSGAYTIDWGDGIIENYATGVACTHKYEYVSISNSTISSRGYKQVLVSITPQSGSDLTLVRISKPPMYNSNVSNVGVNYLDIIAAGHNISTLLTTSTNNVNCLLLERFVFIGSNSITTNAANMFWQDRSLRKVILDTSKATNVSYMFYGCSSLTETQDLDLSKAEFVSGMYKNCASLRISKPILLPLCTSIEEFFSGCTALRYVSAITCPNSKNMTATFMNCYSLTKVELFDTSNVTNASSTFYNCYSILELPYFDLSRCTNMSNYAYSCYALKSIPQYNTHNVVSILGMIGYCGSLKELPAFDFSSVTSMGGFAYACSSLREIPSLQFGAVTDASSAFNSCKSLVKVGTLSFSSGPTNTTQMFMNCWSLEVGPNLSFLNATAATETFTSCYNLGAGALPTGLTVSIGYRYNKLSRSALVAIFNALGTANGTQTISISYCLGAASLTAEDKAIATNKGWTLVL